MRASFVPSYGVHNLASARRRQMTTAHPEHPVVRKLRLQRAQDVQLRTADAITAFAGSMPFVCVHVVVLAVWMLLVEGRTGPPSSSRSRPTTTSWSRRRS
jgi:uncharacterized membrane protein